MLSIGINLTQEVIDIPPQMQMIEVGGFSSTFQYQDAMKKALQIIYKFLAIAEGHDLDGCTITAYILPDAYHFGILLALRKYLKIEPRVMVVSKMEYIDLHEFTLGSLIEFEKATLGAAKEFTENRRKFSG